MPENDDVPYCMYLATTAELRCMGPALAGSGWADWKNVEGKTLHDVKRAGAEEE